MISTTGKKLVNLQGLPYMPPNMVNFDPQMVENGWRVFAHPSSKNFAFGDNTSLTAWALYSRHQANLGTCYVVAQAYSVEQQNACLLYTSPSPRDGLLSRMPSSA